MDKEIQEFLLKIETLTKKYPDLKAEAYNFVLAGLSFAMSKLKERRHLTGQELSRSLSEYAIDQFGPMAKAVLEFWGVHETFDFGRIVYRLIDVKLMSKTEEDSIEDFKDVYTFDEVFGKNYDFLSHVEEEH